MKKINRRVFAIVLISTILVNVLLGFFFNNVILNIKNLSDTNFENSKEIIENNEEISDVEGYGALLYSFSGMLGIFGNFIIIMFEIFICIIINFPIILYLISYFIHRKKESKKRIIISLVLTVVAIVLQIFSIVMMVRIFGYFAKENILLLTTLMIEIVTVMSILFYYVINIKNIKNLLKTYSVNK